MWSVTGGVGFGGFVRWPLALQIQQTCPVWGLAWPFFLSCHTAPGALPSCPSGRAPESWRQSVPTWYCSQSCGNGAAYQKCRSHRTTSGRFSPGAMYLRAYKSMALSKHPTTGTTGTPSRQQGIPQGGGPSLLLSCCRRRPPARLRAWMEAREGRGEVEVAIECVMVVGSGVSIVDATHKEKEAANPTKQGPVSQRWPWVAQSAGSFV